MRKCFICEEAAHDVTEPGFEGRSISCPSCDTVYDVPHAGLDRLRSMTLQDRKSALDAARRRAKPQDRVVVRMHD